MKLKSFLNQEKNIIQRYYPQGGYLSLKRCLCDFGVQMIAHRMS